MLYFGSPLASVERSKSIQGIFAVHRKAVHHSSGNVKIIEDVQDPINPFMPQPVLHIHMVTGHAVTKPLGLFRLPLGSAAIALSFRNHAFMAMELQS